MSLRSLDPVAVKLTNDVVLHYVREGQRDAPTMIMIHGAMGDWRAWEPQWDAFTEHFDCISYSRRYSHPNPNALNTRDHSAIIDAEDLGLLMDALAVERAILLGSSYGGFTALAFAVQSPDRVAAVVSVEAPMMRFNEPHPDRLAVLRAFEQVSSEPARALFESGADEQAIRVLTGGIVGQPPEDIPDEVMTHRMINLRAAKSLAISTDEFPMLDRAKVAALTMPVMLISGADTAPVHAVTFKSVAEAMPQARTLIVSDAGHTVTRHQPDIFNTSVQDFLREHGLSAPLATADGKAALAAQR